MNTLQLREIFRNIESYTPFKPGQPIFTEGEFGDVMYVLMEGLVDVVVQGKVVGTFEPIEIFGEMAVIDAGPRSASVVAKTECKLIPINQKRFIFLVQQKPQFALHIMRMLVERIRWMDANHAASLAAQGAAPAKTGDDSQPAPENAAGESSSADSGANEAQAGGAGESAKSQG